MSRIRLSLDVDRETKQRLLRLVGKNGATTITEVIRRAAVLAEVVEQHQAAGGKVVLEKEGRERQILLIL